MVYTRRNKIFFHNFKNILTPTPFFTAVLLLAHESLMARQSTAPANPHDYLLHRKPKPWPHALEPLTAAFLPDDSLARGQQSAMRALIRHTSHKNARTTLFLIHGFAHSEAEYELHAQVLRLSHRMALLRTASTLLYINNREAMSTEALIHLLRLYQERTLRMLVHTNRDIGHLCSEFQLLAVTAHVWRHFKWVVYISGPDTYLTPVATARIDFFVKNSTKALHTDSFPSFSRHHRYALDVFLFRPSAGFLGPMGATIDAEGGRASRDGREDSTLLPEASMHQSVWLNATAMCMAHRAFNGLPETVLHWVRETYSLERAALGKRAPWAACLRSPVYHCPLGVGGVWHTHNASAVSEWLALRASRLAKGLEMVKVVEARAARTPPIAADAAR